MICLAAVIRYKLCCFENDYWNQACRDLRWFHWIRCVNFSKQCSGLVVFSCSRLWDCEYCRLMAKACQQLTKLESEGREVYDAWNRTSVDLVTAAKVQSCCLTFILIYFFIGISEDHTAELWMRLVCLQSQNISIDRMLHATCFSRLCCRCNCSVLLTVLCKYLIIWMLVSLMQ